VDQRLRRSLRARLCGLQEPEADTQAECLMVPRSFSAQRGCIGIECASIDLTGPKIRANTVIRGYRLRRVIPASYNEHSTGCSRSGGSPGDEPQAKHREHASSTASPLRTLGAPGEPTQFDATHPNFELH